MVERFGARLRRLDEDRQIFARLLLADEIGQRLGPQRGFERIFFARSGVTRRSVGLLGHLSSHRPQRFADQHVDRRRLAQIVARRAPPLRPPGLGE